MAKFPWLQWAKNINIWSKPPARNGYNFVSGTFFRQGINLIFTQLVVDRFLRINRFIRFHRFHGLTDLINSIVFTVFDRFDNFDSFNRKYIFGVAFTNSPIFLLR